MKLHLKIFLLCISILFLNYKILTANELRVGLLKYGSVNWEMDIIEKNELDKKYNFKIKKTFFSNLNAAAIGLQGKSVDIIVRDWIWVSRQRSENRDYVFYPHSMSVGGIMVHHDSEIMSIEDLSNKKLGVAGSSLDKSWLLFRAYSKKKIYKDPIDFLKPAYAAPPLLNELIKKKELDAVLNYWHYKAKLEEEKINQH